MKYASYCQGCVLRGCDKAEMLTGYTITASRCDCCGRTSDLATVKADNKEGSR